MPFATIETVGPLLPQGIEQMLTESPSLFSALEGMASAQVVSITSEVAPVDPADTPPAVLRAIAAIISHLAAPRISSLSPESYDRIRTDYREALEMLTSRAASGSLGEARSFTETGAGTSESGAAW